MQARLHKKNPLFLPRTGLHGIAALLAPGRFVQELLESLLVSFELLFENMEAFETMFADGDKLSVESLKGFEGAGFGHGQDSGEDRRMAITSGCVLPNLLPSLRWLGDEVLSDCRG